MNEDFVRIGQQWDELFALCNDPRIFDARAQDVSSWSAGQQLAHIGLSTKLIAGAIDNMVANPEENAGLKPEPVGEAVLQAGAIPRGAGQAPEPITPEDAPKREDVQAQLTELKGRWDAMAAQSKDLEGVPATFRHFALGNFTCMQWVRFVRIHTDHHIAIIRDILAATNVPSPLD